MLTHASRASSDYRELVAEMDAAIAAIRDRLRTILDRLLPSGYGARSLGRALDLSRMTAWRCWTVAHVSDAASAVAAMPSAWGWQRLLDRLRERGVSAREIAALRSAIAGFHDVVKDRQVDRLTLRSLAAGRLDPPSASMATLKARRSAHAGNAEIYGVQGGSMAVGQVLAPVGADDSSKVSLGIATAFEGLHRSRPGIPWPILQKSVIADAASTLTIHSPLGDGGLLPSLIAGASSPRIAGVELRPGRVSDQVETIDLAAMSPGRRGGIHASFAEYLPSVDGPASREIAPVCLMSPMRLPVRHMVFDLLIHRGIPRHTEPAGVLFGSPIVPEDLHAWRHAPRLQLEAAVKTTESIDLPGRRTFDAAYAAAIGRVVAAMGASLEEFEIVRLELPFPPLFAVFAYVFEIGRLAKRRAATPRRRAKSVRRHAAG